MDDEVETRLPVAFAQYADELLKELGRDRAGFWAGQLEVVDALLSDASNKIAREVAVKGRRSACVLRATVCTLAG